MKTPDNHPQRIVLNDEAHARPPEAMRAPLRISYLALLTDAADRGREHVALCELAQRFGAIAPSHDAPHYSADYGVFRIKRERHTEFTRYKFMVAGDFDDPFEQPALAAVPADWIAALPGQLMVAVHAGFQTADRTLRNPDEISQRMFDGNALVGAEIGDGVGIAFTDFRIHGDGFSRLYVQNVNLGPRQAGRMIQRLLEIDTYRMLALLALPLARELVPFLEECERKLVEITTAITTGNERDEPGLLDRLTRLSAAVESSISNTQSRFSAAAAYSELVDTRIAELREQRIQGLQTFSEFTGRRLAPAMNTCRWVALRQRTLSEGVARASQLLSTRVGITRERQNQALLESMNRRAKMQLRLQQTVEGLSVAAITYYVVGLIGYGAKAVKGVGVELNPDLVMGLSIPLVATAIALAVRRTRRAMSRSSVGSE